MFEIRYAPGGDENSPLVSKMDLIRLLRLDMPREGTKTIVTSRLTIYLY